MDITAFIKQFEKGALKEWNHALHLRMALYYIYNAETEHEALIKIRCGLIRFGTLTIEEYVCPTRYHETITCFWVEQLWKFVLGHAHKDIKELEKPLLESELASTEYIKDFYTEDVLNSEEAQAVYLPPNLNN